MLIELNRPLPEERKSLNSKTLTFIWNCRSSKSKSTSSKSSVAKVSELLMQSPKSLTFTDTWNKEYARPMTKSNLPGAKT